MSHAVVLVEKTSPKYAFPKYRTGRNRGSTGSKGAVLATFLDALGAFARQTVGHHIADDGVEGQAEVGGGDFEIDLGIAGAATTPIHDAVGFRIDGSFKHGFRQFDYQGFEEI